MRKMTIFILSAVFLLTFWTGLALSAPGGAIVVSAEGQSDAAMVSAIAARAPYFLIFDGEGKFQKAVANPHKDAGGNTAALVTGLLIEKGATAIVAGHFGGKMVTALQEKGIVSFERKGIKAGDAVREYLQQK